MRDISLIFETRRINRLNAIMFTALDLALAVGNLAFGRADPFLLAMLAAALVVAWAVLLLPFPQIVKCVGIPLLPGIAILALALHGSGVAWYGLTMLGTIAMGMLYFMPGIVLFDAAMVNLFFVITLAAGKSVVGPEPDLLADLQHLLRIDLVAVILYFGTKWARAAAQSAISNAERSEAADKSLRELNATLEAKVEERTRELEARVAELRTAQEQLVISEKQASLGGLVAGVAHEVNTPLGVCITAVTKLKADQDSLVRSLTAGGLTKAGLAEHVNAQGETLEIVMGNLFRAAEIIKSFKDIAVDQGSEALVEFSLDDYIRTILTSLKHELKNRTGQINVNFSNFVVESCPGAFSHIVTNLIMNTLMHAYEPHARVSIDFDARREPDGTAVFTYTDHGKGIPPEIIGRIFEPFYTTRRGSGGSGLGLFIVYNSVRDKLGGTIECESEPGSWTRFTIRF